MAVMKKMTVIITDGVRTKEVFDRITAWCHAPTKASTVLIVSDVI